MEDAFKLKKMLISLDTEINKLPLKGGVFVIVIAMNHKMALFLTTENVFFLFFEAAELSSKCWKSLCK